VTVNRSFQRALYVCSMSTAALAGVALGLLLFELSDHLIDRDAIGCHGNRVDFKQSFPGLNGTVKIIEVMEQDNSFILA